MTVIETNDKGPTGFRLANRNGTAGGYAFGACYATDTFTDHGDDPYTREIERLDQRIAALQTERKRRIEGLAVVEVEVITYDPDVPPMAAVLPSSCGRSPL